MAKPKTIPELPDEKAIEILKGDMGMTEEQAIEFLAIARGETEGDEGPESTAAPPSAQTISRVLGRRKAKRK